MLFLLLVILSTLKLFPTVETSQAGPGNLEVTVNGGRVPTSAQAQGPHTYAISFTPREAIAHTVDLRFNGEDVPGKVWYSCWLCTHSQACIPVGIAPILRLVDLSAVHTLTSSCRGSSRNSELIINMSNILLQVINDNFSMLQFSIVVKLFLHCFTFCVQCLLGGHHPAECTGAHEIRSCIFLKMFILKC